MRNLAWNYVAHLSRVYDCRACPDLLLCFHQKEDIRNENTVCYLCRTDSTGSINRDRDFQKKRGQAQNAYLSRPVRYTDCYIGCKHHRICLNLTEDGQVPPSVKFIVT